LAPKDRQQAAEAIEVKWGKAYKAEVDAICARPPDERGYLLEKMCTLGVSQLEFTKIDGSRRAENYAGLQFSALVEAVGSLQFIEHPTFLGTLAKQTKFLRDDEKPLALRTMSQLARRVQNDVISRQGPTLAKSEFGILLEASYHMPPTSQQIFLKFLGEMTIYLPNALRWEAAEVLKLKSLTAYQRNVDEICKGPASERSNRAEMEEILDLLGSVLAADNRCIETRWVTYEDSRFDSFLKASDSLTPRDQAILLKKLGLFTEFLVPNDRKKAEKAIGHRFAKNYQALVDGPCLYPNLRLARLIDMSNLGKGQIAVFNSHFDIVWETYSVLRFKILLDANEHLPAFDQQTFLKILLARDHQFAGRR
jgi:hypothetical protein